MFKSTLARLPRAAQIVVVALAMTIAILFFVKMISDKGSSILTITLSSTDPHYTGYELKLIADEISPQSKNVLNWDRKTGLSEGVILSISGKNLKDHFIPHAVKVTANDRTLQIIVKAPKSTTPEETAHVCQELGKYLQVVPEVVSYQSYIEGNKAEINVNGNIIAKNLRPSIKNIADKFNSRIKFSGSNHITAEIHGPEPQKRIEVAREVKNVFNTTNGVVDVDWDTDSKLPCVTANLELPIIPIMQIKTRLPKLDKGYSIKFATNRSSCGVSAGGAVYHPLKFL